MFIMIFYKVIGGKKVLEQNQGCPSFTVFYFYYTNFEIFFERIFVVNYGKLKA